MTEDNAHREEIGLYNDVKETLQKKTLGYDNSVVCLSSALRHLDSDVSISFLDKCLFPMVSILLDQNPSKIGGYERGRIEDSLDLAIRLSVHLLKKDAKYLDTLIKIFSRNPTYYAGSKTAWTTFPGDPHVRINCIVKFYDLEGFQIILNLMEAQWLGVEKLNILVAALRESDPTFTTDVSQSILTLLTKQLLEISDETLKKENTDSISQLMFCLIPKKDSSEIKFKSFYDFWLEFTLKMINCTSIVIKLFAWEQIQGIIKEARLARPPANRYLVRNAGTNEVNGIYEGNFKRGDVPLYVKKPEKDGDKLFTLFRCTMRSKQKWWFISVADIEKPGTDKDVDYYQHKSTPEQDMEPPVLGWVVVAGSTAHAFEPAPVLIRLETICDEDGQPITSLMDLLIDWSNKNNLLEKVFGYHSIHREIVSRSTALLTLLSDEDRLSAGDIEAIWKVGLTNQSEETYSEVLTLLANSALHMSDKALDLLMDLVLETLNPSTPSPNSNENILKIAEFLDKIHYEGIKYIRCLTDHAKDRVIELVWKMYVNPAVENYKNHNHIEDLLSLCLRYHRDKDSLLVGYLEECSAMLSLPPSSQDQLDEKKISRLVAALEFLLMTCGQIHDSSVEEFFFSTQFHSTLLSELKRYVSLHCLKTSSLIPPVICQSITKRLHLIRVAFGISSSNKLSMDQLNELWNLLIISPEVSATIKEQFFLFLKSAGVKDERRAYDSAYHITECYQIFETMICNPILDWSVFSEDAYLCFSTYFNGLVKKNDGDKIHSIRLVGLQTLWKIILHISSEESAKEAITLLLSTYQDMLFYDTLAYQNLLEQIFQHFISLQSQVEAEKIPLLKQREISRCTDVLNSLLSKSQSLSSQTSPQSLPHGVRGNIFRIKVNVRYREVVPSTTHYVTVYNKRTPQMEKTPEKTASIDLHPSHTVAILKDKIRGLVANQHNLNGAVPFGSASQAAKRGVTLEFENNFISGDQQSLAHFGITEGSTVIATILQSQGVSAYDVDDYQDSYYINSQNNYHYSNTIAPSRASFPSDSHPLSFNRLVEYITATENFNCLVKMVQLLESQDGMEDISKKVWEILMAVPSQPDILARIEKTMESSCRNIPLESDDDDEISEIIPDPSGTIANVWGSEFQSSSSNQIMATYILQIIDSLLQPAPELTSINPHGLFRLRSGFAMSDGFLTILNYFVSSSNHSARIGKLCLSVALHIIHYCLHDPETHQVDNVLIQQIESFSTHSDLMIEKFLLVAFNSAQSEETRILQNSLETITSLLQIPSLAAQLTENKYSKSLLTSVLKNSSKVVRTMATTFAIEINKSQPVVIHWLVDEFDGMSPNDEYCYDIIQIINLLLAQTDIALVDAVLSRLIEILQQKFSTIMLQLTQSNYKVSLTDFSRQTLLGCLELVKSLLLINSTMVISSPLGENLIGQFMTEYLFAIPVDGHDKLPLCDVSQTRKAAFDVLNMLLKESPLNSEQSPLNSILGHLTPLHRWASTHIKYAWSIQTSYELKKSNIPHAGLKNQGCTCYLNSLIQQLFMNENFRKIVMQTKIHKKYRSSVWHIPENELIGQVFMFEWTGNNIWKRGQVVAYDEKTRLHTVEYEGSPSEIATFSIHSGRMGKETGRVKSVSKLEETSEISDREYAALMVLEQLQRLFCYLEKSKKRFYDPRMFIESCKTLNLNFNIYHQNDATEFYDQLLDRLETAMKGQGCYTNAWSDLKTQIFGGKMLAQKIPKECSAYEEDKSTCGHWQSTRKESFLKTELLIRNKEKIEDSLNQLVEGELMDGDNKIMCDVCVQKKDTIRRTCFGTLPNLLVVHLKRFDLDFTTFETVKLNNRMAFPTKLDMFPYTKEGIEYLESINQETTPSDPDDEEEIPGELPATTRQSSKESATDDKVPPVPPQPADLSDYEYELQGVLVHSGIAQGGHYYSFIRESDSEEKWFLFDDDDVSHFSPENIPVQCFGGSYQTSYTGSSTMIEEDRSSNALMLFYKKVKSREIIDEDDSNTEVKGETRIASDYLDGYDAYDREISESNLRHIYTNYLVDPNLHSFVRDLLGNSLPDDLSLDVVHEMDTDGDLPILSPETSQTSSLPNLEMTQFVIKFFLDVVLHCRERNQMKKWLQIMKDIFTLHPASAVWLIRYVIGNNASVMKEFLFHCGDALARATFAQLISVAFAALYSTSPEMADDRCLLPFLAYKNSEIIQLITQQTHDIKTLFLAFVMILFSRIIPDVPSYLRTSDEVFNLIRDLSSSIPPLRNLLVQKDMIAHLCFFIAPENAHVQTKETFKQSHKCLQSDVKCLYVVIFEAIGALLNLPQKQKLPLLIEKSNIWDPELTDEAKEALSIIFKESSHFGGMDSRDIISYMDKIHESDDSVPKVTALQVRSILDRYDTTTDGKLSLSGFLRYYADTALYQPKSVWKDLKAFNFQNDFTRASGILNESTDPSFFAPLDLPPNSRSALLSLFVIEIGLEFAENVGVAILKRLCWKDSDASEIMCKMTLTRLKGILRDWSYNPSENLILGVFRLFVRLDDGLLENRLTELVEGNEGLLTIIEFERTNPPRQAHSTYSHTAASYDTRPLTHRYLELLRELYATPSIAEWINQKSAQNPSYEWLVSQVSRSHLSSAPPTGTGVKNKVDELTSSLEGTCIIIAGSGAWEVDGRYTFYSVLNGAGHFRKTMKYVDEIIDVSIYRCRMQNGSMRWFISIVPDNRDPGTEHDTDFYYSPVVAHDNSDGRPPLSKWVSMDPKYEPVPTLVISRTVSSKPRLDFDDDGRSDDEDDSDHDDSMAVIDDENDFPYNSAPGTPQSP